jgi:hypothetical protein
MVVISQPAMFDILVKLKILIVKNSIVCRSHLDEKGFILETFLNDIVPNNGSALIDLTYVKQLIQNLIESKSSSQIFKPDSAAGPIEENSLRLIGLTKSEFLYLTEYVAQKLKVSKNSTKEQALFIHLLWLRTGMTMLVNIHLT